jgi:hypothetical protein
MKYLLLAIPAIILTGIFPVSTKKIPAIKQPPVNTLSDAEKKEGWKLLFDGKTTTGWHTFGQSAVGSAWKVDNETLALDASNKSGYQTKGGGDVITNDEYENFDLKIEWKISKNGNSGILFDVKEDAQHKETWYTGPEMQVLDNEGHDDGKIKKHRAGDLYDLISSSTEPVKAVGEWNQVEIKLNKGKLDLFMNGVNIVSTTMWDDNWWNLVKGSKFVKMPDFTKFKSGHIALQDHGCDVWYRNIKIRKL